MNFPSEEYERQLCYTLLIYPDRIPDAMASVSLGDFCNSSTKLCFAAILDLDEAQKKIGPLQVAEEMDEPWAQNWVVELLDQAPGMAVDVEPIAKRIASFSRARRLQELLRRALLDLSSEDAEDVKDALERELESLDQKESVTNLAEVKQVGREAVERLESIATGKFYGKETGIAPLDRILTGLRPGLAVLAGRPAMGKSALALAMVTYWAKTNPVLFFSLEMPNVQNGGRLLQRYYEGDPSVFSGGRKITPDEWRQITQAEHAMNQEVGGRIWFSDASRQSPASIIATSRRWANRTQGRSKGVIVIDYLQLCDPDERQKGANREREIAEVSRRLHILGRELDVPILALAQLNRDVERRPDKRPMLSDLRESGALEQDPTAVVMLYCDDQYCELCSRGKRADCKKEHEGLMEVLVRKNRFGPVGAAFLRFDRKRMRFAEITAKYENSNHEPRSRHHGFHQPDYLD